MEQEGCWVEITTLHLCTLLPLIIDAQLLKKKMFGTFTPASQMHQDPGTNEASTNKNKACILSFHMNQTCMRGVWVR